MSDITGLDSLLADLTSAPLRVQAKVAPVVIHGAGNIQREWRERASGLAHAPLYPSSITFDAGWKRGGFEAEVGPDKERPQGPLGNLIEYGSAKNPPHGNDVAVADAETPRFEKAIANLADGLL